MKCYSYRKVHIEGIEHVQMDCLLPVLNMGRIMFKLTVQIDSVEQSCRTAQLTTISLCFLRQQWHGTKSKQAADVQEAATKQNKNEPKPCSLSDWDLEKTKMKQNEKIKLNL